MPLPPGAGWRPTPGPCAAQSSGPILRQAQAKAQAQAAAGQAPPPPTLRSISPGTPAPPARTDEQPVLRHGADALHELGPAAAVAAAAAAACVTGQVDGRAEAEVEAARHASATTGSALAVGGLRQEQQLKAGHQGQGAKGKRVRCQTPALATKQHVRLTCRMASGGPPKLCSMMRGGSWSAGRDCSSSCAPPRARKHVHRQRSSAWGTGASIDEHRCCATPHLHGARGAHAVHADGPLQPARKRQVVPHQGHLVLQRHGHLPRRRHAGRGRGAR